MEVVKATASSMYGSALPTDHPHARRQVTNTNICQCIQWGLLGSGFLNGDGGCNYRRVQRQGLSHGQKFGKVDLVAEGNMLSDKTCLSVGHERRMRATSSR